MTRSVFLGTDPTITSGSPVIRADQWLLGRFGKLRADRFGAAKRPLLHLGDIV